MLPAGRVADRNGSRAVGHNKPFPMPLATHDDVVKDSSLFWETLRSFHRVMDTKIIVPVMGGKELNLHVLYAEVTRRGGFDKVVTLKKWREVSATFGFSATTTSASYALRKHYLSFLYHYEKAYFMDSQPSPHSDALYFQATGTIDAKFEYGYLVTMELGSEILHGVLYQPQHNIIVQSRIDSFASATRRRRRKRRNKGDPTRPKTNRSGYNFFFAEKHVELKSKCPDREREFTKMIGESWNNLPPEDKMVYQMQGLKDKERYQMEMVEYRRRAKD